MRLCSEASNLAECVNPRVCSPCCMQNDVFLRQAAQHFNDFSLNRGFARLNLPAVEIGAVVRDGELEIAHAEPGPGHHNALRTKRLPGFTATLPPRQSGQSSSSYLSMDSWMSDCASTSKSIFPPLRSISAPAATTRAPASSTTRMASSVEPPVVQTSSTTNTCWSGARDNPRRSVIMPLPSRSTKSAGVPPPGELFSSGSARATSCPMTSPPIAGETTASILTSEKSAASACPSVSAKRGYCRTSAHWTYVPLCKPLDSSKCPWRMAPAASNSFSNSSRFRSEEHTSELQSPCNL